LKALTFAWRKAANSPLVSYRTNTHSGASAVRRQNRVRGPVLAIFKLVGVTSASNSKRVRCCDSLRNLTRLHSVSSAVITPAFAIRAAFRVFGNGPLLNGNRNLPTCDAAGYIIND
jgi:hypothetical protein